MDDRRPASDGAAQPTMVEVPYNLAEFSCMVALAGSMEGGAPEPVVMLHLALEKPTGDRIYIAFPMEPDIAARMSATLEVAVTKIADGAPGDQKASN